ncbi:MAG: hypothetical protein LLG01_01625 [Planctomycetaceae bacterium]|nr:hypothetical protein [Planctomycetaceae bacterium]
MRGFRPSRVSGIADLFDDSEGSKEEKVYRYMMRAQQGLPLFDPEDEDEPAERHDRQVVQKA